MRHITLSFTILFAACISGCTTIDISEHLITLDQDFFKSSTESTGIMRINLSEDKSTSRLEAAYRQVKGLPIKNTRVFTLNTYDQKPLPEFLAKEPLVSKIIIAAYGSLVESKVTSIKVTTDDVKNINLMIARNFGASASAANIVGGEKKKKVFQVAKKYLMAYYTDTENGFTDREGIVYKRPEFKGSVTNDVITAVVGIFIEAIFDGLLETPVYVDKDDNFQTKKGLEPTAHKLGVADKVKVVSRGEKGIDDLELKAIRYLSGLAGDQSKAVSGAVYRLFGDLEIGFVVGGHFSFGDNDTLAKILDTTFEIASKRIVEEESYQGFKRLTIDYSAARSLENQSAASQLLLDFNEIAN